MTKRALFLGAVAVAATLSAGCSTLPSARSAGGSVEEVDMLADVELTEAESAALSDGGVADAPLADGAVGQPQRENSVEVAWQPSGKNIQLAKLPPVAPVTASMLRLDKRSGLLAPPQAGKTDAPAHGRYKSSPSKE